MTRELRDAPQFYLTAPSPCPYLPGMLERKVFTHLVGKRAIALNDTLTQTGFRRSQTIAYRPACENCRACVSVRVLVDEFVPSASQRRVLRANADIVGAVTPSKPTGEQYALFRDYLDARHPDGGMADMSMLDYSMMVEDSHIDSVLAEYRRARRGSAPRRLPHRPARRRAFAGLFVLCARGVAPLARRLHDPRPHRQGAPPRPAARLSRLLGRGLAQNGLQGRLSAAGAARAERMGAGRAGVRCGAEWTRAGGQSPCPSPCLSP